MPITNVAEPKYYPGYVEDTVALLAKVRDFNAVRETHLTSGDTFIPQGNVIYGWQYDTVFHAATGVLAVWWAQAQADIQVIRGVVNVNPLADIDPIEPPEPDLIDYYYFVPGTKVGTIVSNPTDASILRVKADWSWPPWGPLPPAPPPVNDVPVAEDDYAYIAGFWSIVQYLTVDRQPSKLWFEYAGYFSMEMARRCYELFRLTHDDDFVKALFLTAQSRLTPLF